jgi:outer membrane protein assembly factor BamB
MMMKPSYFISSVLLTVVTLLNAVTTFADWPSFRGSDRSAVSRETGLLKEWPAGGPPLAWKAEGSGRGYTSLAIVKGRIFLLGDSITEGEGTDEYLLCLDLRDGKRLWAAKTGPAWKDGQPNWQSSRSTPTVDEDRIYALTANGDLICCHVDSGKEVWRKNLKTDFGGKKADIWGYSESVLVDGKQLVCTPGGEKATMVALDKTTGATLWSSVREGDRGAGHASIVTAEIGGVRVYVQTTGSGALGVRASDGKLLWSYPIDKTTAVAPTPIIRDDLVFFAAGYKRGGALLKQIPAENQGVTIQEVYGLKPELSNKHGGIVRVGEHVFGDSDDGGIPFCAEMATGNVLWRKRGSGNGSIAMAAADGRLYLHYANGTMVLAKADPTDFVEVGSFSAPGSGERPSWAHPVIFEGKLYLRENNMVLCYDIRDRAAAAK